MNKILKYLGLIIISIIVGCILTFYINDDCIRQNIKEGSYGYISGIYCESENNCGQHYAEYYIKDNNFYVFDETTGNSGKLLGEYLYEQRGMKKGGIDLFLTPYFYISKFLI